jgi:GH18 family chitinase
MKTKMRASLSALIISLLFLNQSFGQMVKGYFPYYRSIAQANAVNYSQLTDVIYAFADLDANGNLTIRGPGGIGDLSLFNAIKTNCNNNGVRLWVAIGGWGLSGNFPTVAGNATRRTTLANACLNLCTTHGLAGIDIDWEFPGAADAANYTAMLAAIKGTLGSTYKLSAALGGESFTYSCVNQGHAVGVEPAAFTHLDFFNIMSYDAPSCFANHTSLDFMQRSMDGWFAKGCPYEKMIPGIAFYARCAAVVEYNVFSNSAPATYFNDTDGIYNGYCYDSKPTIEAKTNWAMCVKGAPGMMVWELSQDRSDAYALLPVMKAAVNACACPFSDPNLGPDVSLCGVASVVLNSGIATNSPSRTFTWRRNGTNVVTNSATANTYNATAAGTYEVVITEGTCTKSDQIVVTSTLAVPDLGADRNLCNPSSLTLSPSNLASFPGGTAWQWSYAGSPVTGATSSSLSNVRRAGLYRLTASISGCTSTFDEINITSSLPVPVDACIASAGTANLSITNPGLGAGPYRWYASSSGGSVLATGTSYSPSVSSTTTYYVEDGAAFSTTVGPPASANGMTGVNDWGGPTQVNFNALSAFTLNAITIRALTWGCNRTVTMEIRDASNALVPGSNVTLNIDATSSPACASVPTFYRVAYGSGVNIPAGNGYRMIVTGGTVGIGFWSGASYPMTYGTYLSITGSNVAGDYPAIHNWEISSGSSCARLPVIATVGSGCSSLPVDFEEVKAEKMDEGARISWKTSWEINNDHFEVQRSEDGINFKGIGIIKGSGTSSQINQYSFSDADVKAEIIYYRILQRDLDGRISYSSVVVLSGLKNEMLISPNPFSFSINIQIPFSSSPITIKVFDLAGNLVLQKEFLAGNTELRIGEELSDGAYILQIFTDEIVRTERIIKVK